MTERLRIVVAEDEPDLLADLRETLVEFGHHVVGTARTGTELVDRCRELEPDLIVTDVRMPDLDGLEALATLRDGRPVPAVVVSAHHDEEFVDRALEECVLAYLVKPLNEESLKTSIDVAMRRFREFTALREQAAGLQQALEERKIVERAKGVLMKRAGLDEPEAFRRLQRLSSQKNRKMIDIARSLVEADEAFGD